MVEGKRQTRQQPVRTIMYSVETIVSKGGTSRQEVVTHHLPWPKDSPKIEPLKARGYTFERPVVELPIVSKEDAPGIVLVKTPEEVLKEKRQAQAARMREAKAKSRQRAEALAGKSHGS